MPQTSHKTGRELAATTIKKYELALKRIEVAEKDLSKPAEVIAWIKSLGVGDTSQKVYYSAIKYYLARPPFVFPQEYQEELNRLYAIQNAQDGNQQLSEKQVSNFVPYADLLKVQQRLGEKEDKSDKDWRDYLIASLYTLQPPVRADYGSVQIVGKRSATREGNQLVLGQKGGAYFIWKEYKTKGDYGTVEVRVSDALLPIINNYFEHLGKRPKYLLGRAIDSNDLLGEIQHAFRSTGKNIGINLLRHAYIKHHFPSLTTIAQKDKLAREMLHSRQKQEEYNSQNV
jgi:hypothetical protein